MDFFHRLRRKLISEGKNSVLTSFICHFKIQILDGLELNSGFDLYVTHHNRDYVDKRTGTY